MKRAMLYAKIISSLSTRLPAERLSRKTTFARHSDNVALNHSIPPSLLKNIWQLLSELAPQHPSPSPQPSPHPWILYVPPLRGHGNPPCHQLHHKLQIQLRIWPVSHPEHSLSHWVTSPTSPLNRHSMAAESAGTIAPLLHLNMHPKPSSKSW